MVVTHRQFFMTGTVLRSVWALCFVCRAECQPVTVRHCSEIAASNKRERPSWQPSFCQIQFPRGWHILCSFFPKLGIMPDWFRSTVCKHWLHGGFHLNMFPPFSLSWNEEQNGGERSKTKAWKLDCFGSVLLKNSHCLLVHTCGRVSSPSPAQRQ